VDRSIFSSSSGKVVLRRCELRVTLGRFDLGKMQVVDLMKRIVRFGEAVVAGGREAVGGYFGNERLGLFSHHSL